MTLYAPLDAPSNVDDSLAIFNVSAQGGWVRGPRIRGVLVSPGGDWSRAMPSGVVRLDVRLTVRTDDGALIYVSYGGVERDLPKSATSHPGATLGPKDVGVWLIAPTFETSATKYAWLDEVQGVGRMVEYKDGAGGYVKYEIYSVR
ncbi:MAG: DUF3237 domain-containing protein [Proteobacteria bacterium]|nr:DUF3237 domain-containing protein [Pseudomonadota bacterium]